MTMNFTYEVHLVADGKFGTQERVSFTLKAAPVTSFLRFARAKDYTHYLSNFHVF